MFVTRLIRFLGRSDGSLQEKAARSAVWVGLSSFAGAGISFLKSIILARLLMPEVFGLMAICSMIIQGIEIFTETGFTAALIHRQQKFEEAKDTAFTIWVLRGFGLVVLGILAAPWIATFYEQPILTIVLSVVSLTFLINAFRNVNTIALQKELDFKRLIYIEQSNIIFNLVIAVALAYWLRNVWALVYAQLASVLISVMLSYLLVAGRPRFRFDITLAKELFAYGKFMTGLAVVVYLTNQLDNAIIGKIIGMEALGYYTLAYTLANLPTTGVSKIAARVLFPMFSKLQNDRHQLQEEYMRGLRLLIAIVVPITCVIVVLADEIVLTLYGATWFPASTALEILAVFGCFQTLWMLNGYLVNALGKPKIDFYVNSTRLLLVLILLYPFTVSMGIAGASLAITIPMSMQFVVGLYLAKTIVGVTISQLLRPLLTALLQGLILVGIMMGLKSIPMFEVGSALRLALFLAVAVTVVLFFNREDIMKQLRDHNIFVYPMRGTA